MKSFLHTCGIVVGLLNIALFIFWLSLSHHDVMTKGVLEAGYDFDQISLQIAILESVVAFATIILAVLGIFGFQVIAERAEVKADRAARDVVMRLHKDGRLTPAGSSIPPHSTPPVGNVPTGHSQAEEEV